jgi:hypothetical protein
MKSEPTMREESLRIQIALGSITMLLVLGWMFTFMIAESALMNNNFRALHRDPGLDGLRYIIYIVPFYALLPLYVYSIRNLKLRLFRWLEVAAAGLGFVFWILHHLSHWSFGQRPSFSSHVVDLTLHAVGLWLLVNSIKWARLPLAEREVEQASVARRVALQQS